MAKYNMMKLVNAAVFFATFVAGTFSLSINTNQSGNLASNKTLLFGQSFGYPTWPNARVPVVYGPELSTAERQLVDLAIADYKQKTCVVFDKSVNTADPGYVLFAKAASGCGSTNNGGGCYKTGVTTVSVGPDCMGTDTFIHEMGHVLCYGHEQDRADHDIYVYDKISGCQAMGTGTYSEHLYDYLSVMHYDCSYDRCRVPKLPGVPYCLDYELSVLDAEKINHLYNCPGCFSYRFRFPSLTSPSQVFGGGRDIYGRTTSPCRGYVDGNIVVGTATNDLTTCYLPNNGVEFGINSQFEVLTNPSGANLIWVKSTGVIPKGAIPGGRTKHRERIYIGRCNWSNSVTIGKVLASTPNILLIPFGGAERTCTEFEILVCQ